MLDGSFPVLWNGAAPRRIGEETTRWSHIFTDSVPDDHCDSEEITSPRGQLEINDTGHHIIDEHTQPFRLEDEGTGAVVLVTPTLCLRQSVGSGAASHGNAGVQWDFTVSCCFLSLSDAEPGGAAHTAAKAMLESFTKHSEDNDTFSESTEKHINQGNLEKASRDRLNTVRLAAESFNEEYKSCGWKCSTGTWAKWQESQSSAAASLPGSTPDDSVPA
jgi:hypothetical protein